MPTHTLRPFLVAVLASACATVGGGGSTGKFQSKAAVDARVKAINDKVTVSETCNGTDKETPPVGIVEVVAQSDGKVAARAFAWKGTPAQSACIVDAASKIALGPLPGPSVGGIWWFSPPGTERPTPPKTSKGDMVGMQGRLQVEVEACAQRHLPNDFGADVEVSFFILPGGKVIAPTVTNSTAKDGDYETCVQNLVGGKSMPESGFDGPFPAMLSFHVGPVDKI